MDYHTAIKQEYEDDNMKYEVSLNQTVYIF